MKYIVFDIETTCTKNDNKQNRELIEIGAYALDESFKIISSFEKFCKPDNKKLSKFCKNLTGITQENVDKADSFEKVIKQFIEWKNLLKDYIEIWSWGGYDKKQLIDESIKKNTAQKDLIELFSSHVNLKKKFEENFKVKNYEIPEALNRIGKKFDGNLHRGIDDAYNLIPILKFLKSGEKK